LRICMIAYTFYESDGRVLMYAEALSKRGDHVDVIALSRERQPFLEHLNSVNVYRIQKRTYNEKGKLSYAVKLVRFLINSGLLLTRQHLKEPYDLIHVHSVPDFEVFAGLIPKLNGAKIILDIHDIIPEFFAAKFNQAKNSLMFNLLVLVEKISCAFSDHVIIANDLWQKRLISRSVSEDACSVILNYPDPEMFHPLPKARKDDRFVIVYPGSLNWHQGLDIAIKAFNHIKDAIPMAVLDIYGQGGEKKELLCLISKLELENRIFIKQNVPTRAIPQIIANADLGIVPKRAVSFGNEAFSTKILEFMAVGVPVLVSATKIDQYYFSDSLVKFFRPGDYIDMAENILLLSKDKKLRKNLTKNALKFIETNNWGVKKRQYFKIIDSLTKKSSCS